MDVDRERQLEQLLRLVPVDSVSRSRRAAVGARGAGAGPRSSRSPKRCDDDGVTVDLHPGRRHGVERHPLAGLRRCPRRPTASGCPGTAAAAVAACSPGGDPSRPVRRSTSEIDAPRRRPPRGRASTRARSRRRRRRRERRGRRRRPGAEGRHAGHGEGRGVDDDAVCSPSPARARCAAAMTALSVRGDAARSSPPPPGAPRRSRSPAGCRGTAAAARSARPPAARRAGTARPRRTAAVAAHSSASRSSASLRRLPCLVRACEV